MSACISRHGEYSDHLPDELHTCTRCHVLDEDALRGELAHARELIAALAGATIIHVGHGQRLAFIVRERLKMTAVIDLRDRLQTSLPGIEVVLVDGIDQVVVQDSSVTAEVSTNEEGSGQ